ncbi:hypothetical protein NC652_012469 [Populus alba x Populus x berolinensis]|nr:hypothetical protein NC652_012467 [Populus alba x Populus x berolinensis]KAJ6928380.1 hypothetical protein NC652_012469 [Populus alba x Populus x berolinensis]
MTNNNNNNNNNKDAAVIPDKANEHSEAASSPRRSLNNQEEAIAPPRPTVQRSTVETGGPSSVSGPARPAGTEVGTSPAAVTLTGGASPSTPVISIGGSGTTVVDPSVAATGVAGEGSSLRKRSGKGEESSPHVSKKAKAEMDINPDSEPTCSTCGRTFASWKAVFGHMRAHPDRGWRGAFPPPQWSPEKPNDQQGDQNALRSQLAPRLLNLAIGTLNQMKQDRGHEASGSSTNRRNFDLNTEPPRESESNSGSSSPPSSGNRFDLNKPPKADHNNGNEGASK